MGAVLEGFATIGTVIALGALLAHLRVLDLSSQVLLSRLAFFVASPALMVTVLERHRRPRGVLAQPRRDGRRRRGGRDGVRRGRRGCCSRRDLGGTVIGALCSAYVNAGNLGLPIAAYVLGDVALVAPTLLLQMLVMQPIALAVLDHATTPGRVSVRRVLSQPFRTPLTVGVPDRAGARGHRHAAAARRRGPAGPGRRDGGAGDAARVRRLAAARPQARARTPRAGELAWIVTRQAGAAAGRGVPRRAVRARPRGRRRCSR